MDPVEGSGGQSTALLEAMMMETSISSYFSLELKQIAEWVWVSQSGLTARSVV